MRRILLLFLCFSSFYLIYAQQLNVNSFNWDETDITASSEESQMMDQNGKLCALIKVITPLQELSFDVGALGIIQMVQHTSEIWLYVPEGVKRITISHQKYGVLRDYDLGQTLKQGRTYHLRLNYMMESTNIYGSADISSNPTMAEIYIDDIMIGKTPNLITEMETGLHHYRIVIPDYMEVAGQMVIEKGQTTKLFVDLNKAKTPVVSVDNVKFRMIFVDGGTFSMGAINEQSFPDDNEKPAHQVTLSSYYISETEVTQQLWEAVMGTNPSYATGPYRPVNEVSWNDCQSFIEKLNLKTGLNFRLPTEAEWEYAAKGGKKSRGYQYSGNNDLSAVDCYRDNSDESGELKGHYNKVKQLSPNELDLYDMSGGVWEWCQDWVGTYPVSNQINPRGIATGIERVIRGGSWKSSMWSCRVTARNSEIPDYHNNCLGVRLALQAYPENFYVSDIDKVELEKQVDDLDNYRNNVLDENGQEDDLSKSSRDTICFNVNNVLFSMVKVDGGAFKVWNGEDFGSEDIRFLMNALYEGNFNVVLPSYYIGETEVTQELWKAVMGTNPVEGERRLRNNKMPVLNINWNDCQAFLKKLNEITGKDFRLPTDAEWQFAAQGGKKSKGYKYSGSNDLENVALPRFISPYKVRLFQPNELGIYDMSGNVWEWCNDSFDYGLDKTHYYVIRGACFNNNQDEHHIQIRGSVIPKTKDVTLGLRLALSK